MRGTEGVILALGSFRESRESATLARRTDAVAPAGQYLVRIGLMPNIPNQLVAWRIENVVQRHREFNNPQASPKMTTGYRDSVNRLGPQFIGNLLEIFWR